MAIANLEDIKNYYGKVLSSSKDLKTSACCTTDSLPPAAREVMPLLHSEVVERFYGCGSPLPPALEGKTVLDLGCGSGRDCYLLSKLVGPSGRVIGVDMTDEQLAVARRHVEFHTQKFGYRQPNVTFVRGYIEDLETAGIANESVDLVVSNCVVNLSPDKRRVFSEILRVLKPGGELYFSDVFANRRVPKEVQEDPICRGECLGGALYTEDFRRMMIELGVRDFRVVSKSPIVLTDPDVVAKAGSIEFSSITIRAFKIESLEDRCEDYGQVAYYKGTIPECKHVFTLDDHHSFHVNKPLLVCSNTAAMLQDTRFAPHFRIEGDLSTHFGLFDCGPSPVTAGAPAPGGACC